MSYMDFTKGSNLFPGDCELNQDEPIDYSEVDLMPMAKLSGILAAIVAIAISLVFAQHPSVNAYHSGLAGYIASAVFVVASVIGGTTARSKVLMAVLILAFVEPETRITNSLVFNVVSNGLLIGASSHWLLHQRRIGRHVQPILLGVVAFSVVIIGLPSALGEIGWAHIHDSLKIFKYVIVLGIALSLPRTNRTWFIASIGIAIGSAAVALFTIVQALHISSFNEVIFTHYFSSHSFDQGEINYLSNDLLRMWGVSGPINNAVLLSLSISAWFTLLIHLQNRFWRYAIPAGLLCVLLAIYLTASRLGEMSAVVSFVIFTLWWFKSGKPVMNPVAISRVVLAVTLILILVLQVNPAFKRVFDASSNRIIQTGKMGTTGKLDGSFSERVADLKVVDLQIAGDPTKIGRESTVEWVVTLRRYGVIGLVVMAQLWLLLIARSVRAVRNTKSISIAPKLLGLMAFTTTLCGIAVSIGTPTIFEPSLMVVIVSLVGLTGAQMIQARTNQPER